MPRSVVIEQDAVFATVLSLMLEELGWNVTLASCGNQGLGLISTLHPTFVVTDLLLSDLSGLEVCHALAASAEFTHLPIIVLTSHVSGVENTYGPHITFLAKPFVSAELEDAIRRVLSDAATAHTAACENLSRHRRYGGASTQP